MIMHDFIQGNNNYNLKLSENCLTLQDYYNKINNHFITDLDQWKKFKGDAFEVFVECFINYYQEKLGYSSYEPNLNIDRGVDGIGFNKNNEIFTFQCKCWDKKSIITLKDLTTFYQSSRKDFNVKQDNMVLIITCNRDEEIIKKGLKVIDWNDISSLVDNDNEFWDYFNNEWNISKKNAIKRSSFTLFEHQLKAVNSINNNMIKGDNHRGQLICATGGGKSLISIHSINNSIKNGGLIHIIMAPRIALCMQLLNDFWAHKILNFTPVMVCSERAPTLIDYGDKNNEVETSTNSDFIKNKINQSLSNKIPVIFFVTYKSVPRIIEALKELEISADFSFGDEAHNLTNSDHCKLLDTLPTKKWLFGTATRKTHDYSQFGMNKTRYFGTILDNCHISTRELIQTGVIVPPRLQFVDCKYIPQDSNEKITMQSKIIAASIIANLNEIRKYNPNATQRVLVCCKGALDAHLFEESSLLQNYLPNYGLYAVSSLVKKMKCSRKTIFDNVSNLKASSVLFHYDVISEGIDISGFDAVLILRGMDNIKIIQSIGRVLRVLKNDREKIKNNKIIPGNINGWEKPYGWVIVPYMGHEEKNDLIKEVVYALRNNNNLREEEIVFSEIAENISEKENDKSETIEPSLLSPLFWSFDVTSTFEPDNFMKDIIISQNNKIVKERKLFFEPYVSPICNADVKICNKIIEDIENHKKGFYNFTNEQKNIELTCGAYLIIKSLIFFMIATRFRYRTLENIINNNIIIEIYNDKKTIWDLFQLYCFEEIKRTNIDTDNLLINSDVIDIIKIKLDELIINYSEIWSSSDIFYYMNSFISDYDKSNKGAVPTPLELVKEIHSKIDFNNIDGLILDPCCGYGTFLINAKNELLKLGKSEDWIMKKIIGVDNDLRKAYITNALLNPEEKYESKIIGMDFFDFYLKVMESKMRFDLINGNPPFQGQNNKNDSLWPKFIEKSFNVIKDNGHVALITPSNWVRPGKNKGDTKINIMETYFIKNNPVVFNIGECSKHFPNIGNRQNYFSYFVIEKSLNKGETSIITSKSTFNTNTIKLSWLPSFEFNKIDVDIISKIGLKIIENNLKYCDIKWVNERIDLSDNKNEDFCYKVFMGNNTVKYGNKKASFHQHKKVIFKLSPHYNYDKRIVVDNIGDGSYTSCHIMLLSNNENGNIFQSKIYRFLGKCLYNGIDITSGCFQSLPHLDLTKKWSDNELYQYFYLSNEEINHIETNVKDQINENQRT